MTAGQIASIVGVVASMVVGQTLFKVSSQYIVLGDGFHRLLLSLISWQFVLALIFYLFGTLLWVVLLKSVPLSRAYPFVALSFAVLPIVSYVLFSEPINLRYLGGLAVFLSGLYLIATA